MSKDLTVECSISGTGVVEFVRTLPLADVEWLFGRLKYFIESQEYITPELHTLYSALENEKEYGDKLSKESGPLSPSASTKECVEDSCQEKKHDVITWPEHYAIGDIQPINIIETFKLDYHCGTIIKYICRAQYKGKFLEDLKKAKWFLDRRIQLEENVSKK